MKTRIRKALESCLLPVEEIDLGEGWSILVSQHGGHVYGPFSEACPEGIFWYPEAVTEEASCRELIASRVWNTGGDRVWISPEIQFNITDRKNYRETLKQPAIMDPGYYSMYRKGKQVILHQALSLESYNTVEGEIFFDFKRTIQPAPHPLRKLKNAEEICAGLSYAGYEQILDLKCESEQDIFAESWDLLQIRPEGKLYIPMYQTVRGTDHYEEAGEMETVAGHGICLRITGKRRYKIAYPSYALTGRFGYLKEVREGEGYLLIINYPNNPSSMYAEEPPLRPGDRGYSLHVYNDDGSSGGFAEMECNLQTIGRPTGLDHSIDRVSKWIFWGKMEGLQSVSRVLLGSDIS